MIVEGRGCSLPDSVRLISFIDVAGQRAFDELQTVFVPAGGTVPSGPYAFLEQYCVDPDCDCQRVIISAIAHGAPQTILATLGYEWEQHGAAGHDFAILMLEPSATQSTYAPALLELFRSVVKSEPAYVDRLRRHYAEARSPHGAASSPPAPAGRDASDARVKRQFSKEGFLLLVDADGLEVRVIDYHARPLVLPWSELERLRKKAARGPKTPRAELQPLVRGAPVRDRAIPVESGGVRRARPPSRIMKATSSLHIVLSLAAFHGARLGTSASEDR